MGPVEAVRHALGHYAVFRGRAPRSEFWWFVAFQGLVWAVAVAVDSRVLGEQPGEGPLYLLSALALALPLLAVSVRRFHDVDQPWGWVLTYLVPLAGLVTAIALGTREGQPHANRYGPPPRRAGPR